LRLSPLAPFALLAAGCFVDATGGAPGEGGGTTSSTASTGSFTSSDSASSSSTAGATSTSTTATSSSSSGAGGCDNQVLRFDGDDRAFAPYDVTYDFADDFAFGAWVRPAADPKFVAGDLVDSTSTLIRRMSAIDDKGYSMGLVEFFDDGLLHPAVSVRVGNTLLCTAFGEPVPADVWVRISATYLRSGLGDDLTLFVDGSAVDASECGDSDLATFTGELELGNTTEFGGVTAFRGDLDDVFLARSSGAVVEPAHPVPCSVDYVAAFPFDLGGTSVCPAPMLTVNPGTATYAADCELP